MEYYIEKIYKHEKERKLSILAKVLLGIMLIDAVLLFVFVEIIHNWGVSIVLFLIFISDLIFLFTLDRSKIVSGYKYSGGELSNDEMKNHIDNLKVLYKTLVSIESNSGVEKKIDVLVNRYQNKIKKKTESDNYILNALAVPIYASSITGLIGIFSGLLNNKINQDFLIHIGLILVLIIIIDAFAIFILKKCSFTITNWESMISDLEDVRVFLVYDDH